MLSTKYSSCSFRIGASKVRSSFGSPVRQFIATMMSVIGTRTVVAALLGSTAFLHGQNIQQTAALPDVLSTLSTPSAPSQLAVNPATDAAYALNTTGSLLYIDGSQSTPTASPSTACPTASGGAGLGTFGSTPATSQVYLYGFSALDEVSGAVGTCPPTKPAFSTLAFDYYPLVASDSGLGKVYGVSASEGGDTDALVIVNVASATAVAAPPQLDYSASYSSIVADSVGRFPSHLVFVAEYTGYGGGSPNIFAIDPTTSPAKSVAIANYTGTLFVVPATSATKAGQLVVVGSTAINVFNISDMQAYLAGGAVPVPVSSGTYDASGLGTVTGVTLNSPLFDAVNNVVYGNLTGTYAGTIATQELYSVGLTTLATGANSTTGVGAEVGPLDVFNPGQASSNSITYTFALTPNPADSKHPFVYAVPALSSFAFGGTDPNGTGIQLFDTANSTVSTVPLTAPCSSGTLKPACGLTPMSIVADPTNSNVYVTGGLTDATDSSQTDYYVAVVQSVAAPVSTLCATNTTTNLTAGVPAAVTVFYCDSNGNPITNPAYTGTVHFTSSDKQATLPADYTYLAGEAGSHLFNFTLATSGSQTLTYTDTVTSGETGTSAYTVGAAAGTTLVALAGTPQVGSTGTAFATPLAASVTDSFGNGVSGVSVTFTAPSSGASGTFASPGSGAAVTVATASTGIATAPAFTANGTAGAFLVTAAATGIAGTASFSLTSTPPPPQTGLAVLIPGLIGSLYSNKPTSNSVLAASAFDAAGNFYLLDSGLNSITEYPAGGGVAQTIVPRPGQSTTLNTPSDMVIDAAGTSLLVSDYANNRLVRVTLGATPAIAPLTLSGVPAGAAACMNVVAGTVLCLPTGVAEDRSGDIYVSDTGNGRVLKLNGSGGYASTVLTAGASALTEPLGLAVDPGGNLYIANSTGTSSAGNLLKVNPSGTITTLSGGGIVQPFGLAVDPAGDVLFTDSSTHSAGILTAGGSALAFAGDGISTDSGDNGPSTMAGLAGPLGITLGPQGNAYIADSVQSPANGGSVRDVQASQSAIAFGEATVSSATAAQQVLLLNAGANSLSIASAVVTGTNASDFALTNSCGQTLPSGQTCKLSVVFTPSGAGLASATVTITDNSAGTASATQTISLSGTGTSQPVAATPTFSPGPGTYTTPQTVTIADTTAGATIYYTTDGKTTPTTSSTKCAAVCTVTVGTSETIQAIATATGDQNSAVASAIYVIAVIPTLPVPTFNPNGGSVGAGSTVTVTATATGVTTVIYYTTDGSTPSLATASSNTTTKCMASPCKIALSTTAGGSETVRAFASAAGYQDSAVSSATFTLLPQSFTFLSSTGDSPASATVGSPTNGYSVPVTVTLVLTSVNGFNTPVTLSSSLPTLQGNATPMGACANEDGTTTVAGTSTPVSCVFTPSASGATAYYTFTYSDSSPTKAQIRPAAARPALLGVAGSLSVLLFGGIFARRRLLLRAMTMCGLACLVVSLGVLVGACTISPSLPTAATITATPQGSATGSQTVTVYLVYTE